MTAYELVDRRDKINEKIDYLNQCLKELDSLDPYATVTLTRNSIEEIKLDYYGYKVLIEDELKKR